MRWWCVRFLLHVLRSVYRLTLDHEQMFELLEDHIHTYRHITLSQPNISTQFNFPSWAVKLSTENISSNLLVAISTKAEYSGNICNSVWSNTTYIERFIRFSQQKKVNFLFENVKPTLDTKTVNKSFCATTNALLSYHISLKTDILISSWIIDSICWACGKCCAFYWAKWNLSTFFWALHWLR